jgi:hypothetical protein
MALYKNTTNCKEQAQMLPFRRPEPISLHALFTKLLDLGVISDSRVGSIKTAIKQYANMLGYTKPSDCPPTAYLRLEEHSRNRLIEQQAQPTLGTHGLRNLKNNISFVLRKAIEKKLVTPPSAELLLLEQTRRSIPKRRESVFTKRYRIDPIPPLLSEQIDEYRVWSTKLYNRARPKRLKKRPISFKQHEVCILRMAGFLVSQKGMSPESLTLMSIADSDNAIDFVEWCMKRQGKHTAGTANLLSQISAIAKYLEINCESTPQRTTVEHWITNIRDFRASLGAPQRVCDKEARWLTLEQLEAVGRSVYPISAKRLKELVRDKPQLQSQVNNLYKNKAPRRDALRVLQSLLIRFLVRIPLRQRNLREMAWNPNSPENGKNLYRREGSWRLRFSGLELKISEVKGQTNAINHEFPQDLVDLLEDWLSHWRPILIGNQLPQFRGSEKLDNGQELVFLNSRGRPLTANQVTLLFETATYKFTGVSVNPHMIRTIWATEHIKDTNNFIDPAYMLGDTVQTLLNRYAELFDEDCGKRGSAWIMRKLYGESNNETPTKSAFPKLVFPRGR